MQRLLWAAAVLAAMPAYAAHPLITEDTGTQGAGRRQLEVFGERTRANGRREELYTGVFSYGVGEAVDAQFGLPAYRDGAGDVTLDLKWRFLERGPLSFALKPGVTLPTGDEGDGHGTGKATWGSLIVVSYAPGALALHAHAGWRRNENRLGERKSLRQLAAAATYTVGKLRWVGELARETNRTPGGRAARSMTLGAIWSMTPEVDLDLGWRRRYGGAPIDDALLLGVAARW
jgi:Putative MetA-pathway of phenol degradation